MLAEGLITLRQYETPDRPYVLDVWLHGLSVSRGRFLVASAIEDTLARSRVVIACLTDEPGAIVGFAVAESGHEVVRFAAVRERWHGQGILEALVETARAA